jgi:hypothetical protein
MRRWGLGGGKLGGLFGGERETDTHRKASRRPKSGWQTAHDQIDGDGRREGKTTKIRRVLLWTPYCPQLGVGLFNVHAVTQCPSRGIGDHHTTRVRGPMGLWSRPDTGESGVGDKRGKDKVGTRCTLGPRACTCVQCMVLGGSCLLYL